MIRTPAFVQLMWRPAVLLAALPFGLVLWLAAEGTSGNAAHSHETYRDLWSAAVMLPALVSAFLSLLVRELEHTTFAWTLPHLQTSLRNGKIFVGAVIAAIIAALFARVAAAPVAVGAGSLALFCFALGGIAFDPVLPRLQTWTVRVLLIAATYKPLYVEPLIVGSPIFLAALLVLVSALLLEREFSRGLARRRALSSAASVLIATPANTRRYWAQHSAREADWRHTLAPGTPLEWIRAGIYESYGGAKLGYFAHLVSIIVITVTMAVLTGNPSMVVVMLWIFVGMMGIQLSHTFLYPLDRRERGRMFFVSALAQSAATTLAAFVALLALRVPGIAALANISDGSFPDMLTLLATALAWSPIVHWPKLGGSYFAGGAPAAFALRHLVCLAAFVILTTLSHLALTETFTLTRSQTWAVVAALAVTSHAIFAITVRRHFARADLVVPR